MSTWTPSEGLTKAELLMQVLEIEARAAGSVITPVFRHRMVEMIAKALDAVGHTVPGSAGQVYVWKNGTEHAPDGHGDEAVHAQQVEDDGEQPAKVAKAAKGKPGKKPGKRGRPSKAELAARAQG